MFLSLPLFILYHVFRFLINSDASMQSNMFSNCSWSLEFVNCPLSTLNTLFSPPSVSIIFWLSVQWKMRWFNYNELWLFMNVAVQQHILNDNTNLFLSACPEIASIEQPWKCSEQIHQFVFGASVRYILWAIIGRKVHGNAVWLHSLLSRWKSMINHRGVDKASNWRDQRSQTTIIFVLPLPAEMPSDLTHWYPALAPSGGRGLRWNHYLILKQHHAFSEMSFFVLLSHGLIVVESEL